jgi:signal transduction histidine kinase
MGITKKLFIITTLMFGIFIAGTLIAQSLFFERFYISKKRSDLTGYIEKFKTEYNKTRNDQDAYYITEEYERDYNIKIIIMDSNGSLKMLPDSQMHRNDIFRVRDLTNFIKEWSGNGSNFQSFLKMNKITTVLVNRRDTDSRSIVDISPNSARGEIIFALSSLQPVNEALGVIEKIYLYFSIGAVIFMLILAFVYSNMIAKPLLRISKVATRMAKLDFSEKCEVKSQDEIGNVAESLNFLSQNLDITLSELKEANTKLEEDIEKERNLERIRREFVAAVSHELKTPISLIDGYAVGLKDEIFEGEDKDYYLDVIIDEARKMGSLVSDMLDLSHLESGSFKLIREKFNITELIRFTLKKYGALMEDKRVHLEANLLEDILVFADWDRLEQVLTNFITNAIRHVDENGSIYVNMIDKGDNTVIEVENTGSKIPDEEIMKIWDKFYKVDKSRNRKEGGTGIGLSIVKNILLHHGYSFGVQNTERGVKFYFEVPKNYMV